MCGPRRSGSQWSWGWWCTARLPAGDRPRRSADARLTATGLLLCTAGASVLCVLSHPKPLIQDAPSRFVLELRSLPTTTAGRPFLWICRHENRFDRTKIVGWTELRAGRGFPASPRVYTGSVVELLPHTLPPASWAARGVEFELTRVHHGQCHTGAGQCSDACVCKCGLCW